MRLLFFVLCCLPVFSYGQIITVRDVDTREPLVGVAVFNENKSKSATTDFDGKVDLTTFTKSEQITFKEVAHKSASYTKAQIGALKNVVYLKQSDNILGEIVLSASKFAVNKKNIPQKILGISSESILLTNPQTAADLLETSGSVYIQKSQLGGGSPIIRGFSTNRLLITMDGVRFNNAIFRSGNVQNVISIDPFGVDRTEVVLGPGAVIYGSDAVGGVINFHTKKPTVSPAADPTISGSAFTRYSSANNEQTAHFDVALNGKKWGFLTSASISDYGDLRMGSNGPDDYLRREFVVRRNGEDIVVQNNDQNLQVSTGFTSFNLMQKIRYVANPLWNFDLGLFFSNTSDYDRYDRLIQRDNDGNLRSAVWFYGPQKWSMVNFQAHHESTSMLFDRMKITAAFQNFEESRNDRRFGRTGLRTNTERVNAYSSAIDFTKKVGSKKNKIFYGAEYVYNYVNSNGSITDINTGVFELSESRYPDGSQWSSLAAYLSGQFALAEQLNLNTGIRYNHIFDFTDFRGNNQFFNFPFEEARSNFGNVTGSAGLNYVLSKSVQLQTNVSTAFRAPNIDDLGKVFDSGDGNLVVPNPNLKAEYAYNADIGAAFTINNFFKLDVSGYLTLLDDALVRRPFTLNGESTLEFQGEETNIFAIQNAGKAEIRGIELGAELNFSKDLKLTTQYNFTDGEQEEEDGSTVAVRHVAPTFGNTHMIYTQGKMKFDFFAEYNGQFDADELSPEEALKPWLYALDDNGNPFSPSWYTLNLTSQYKINSHWTATANLENITDQRYRPYSSGISAPGANLILAVNYRF